MSFRTMLAGLARARVNHVVIGGVAAAVHGSAAVTIDLDICYQPEPGNVRRLATLLARWNAYPRGVEPGLPFIMDERTMRAAPVLTLVTDEGALDCLDRVAGVGEWDAVRKDSQQVAWDGLKFRVLTLEALIAAKRAANRPKDRAAVIELEAIRALKA
ncbi:MAG TPA: hypothetical protein PLL69_05465 [Gemmatimonadales bacterium]|nr:hypothetical protein [Gemmatimonadales bacterium]